MAGRGPRDALAILMSSSKHEGVWNATLLDDEAEADLVAGLDRSGKDVIDNSYEDVLDLVPENAEETGRIRRENVRVNQWLSQYDRSIVPRAKFCNFDDRRRPPAKFRRKRRSATHIHGLRFVASAI